MDCRPRVFLALILFGGLTGCVGTGSGNAPVTAPVTNTPSVAQIPPNEIKKDVDLPKRMPKAGTLTAWGNFTAQEAESQGRTPLEVNEIRDKARKAYQQAITNDPAYLPAYQGLAHLYLDMNDLDHAVTTYQAALKHHGKNAGLWFDLGMCYSRKKDWGPAVESFGKAVQLDPENRLYVNTMGHALARAGRLQEAVACYKHVNSEAAAYFNVARMLQHMNQAEQSRTYLNTALQKDPQLQPAQEMLAQLEGRADAPVQQTSFEGEAGTVDAIPGR